MERICLFGKQDELMAQPPKEFAPNLFILTRFKKRCVHYELQNLNWIKSLGNIHSPTLFDEFILLFMALEPVVLTQHKDEIKWKWTADGGVLGCFGL
jgi:hypothetical protein